jgi:hypothetical protein
MIGAILTLVFLVNTGLLTNIYFKMCAHFPKVNMKLSAIGAR